jgi:hypothetical protein
MPGILGGLAGVVSTAIASPIIYGQAFEVRVFFHMPCEISAPLSVRAYAGTLVET